MLLLPIVLAIGLSSAEAVQNRAVENNPPQPTVDDQRLLDAHSAILERMEQSAEHLATLDVLLVQNQKILQDVQQPEGGVGGPGPLLDAEQLTSAVRDLSTAMLDLERRMDGLASLESIAHWEQENSKTRAELRRTAKAFVALRNLLYDNPELTMVVPLLRKDVEHLKESVASYDARLKLIDSRLFQILWAAVAGLAGLLILVLGELYLYKRIKG